MGLNKLAIVIPAYKKAYFKEALYSLARQTNKNFNVYIGDDNSPENLREVADLFDHELLLNYTKFNNNIGSKNLVDQWKRCIALTNNEEWIWLFSDDDLAQDNAVERFYKELELNNRKYDVYRFNTCVIDTDGKIINYTPVSPKVESSENLALNILLGKRGNCMPDHIFSRKIYESSGGIVHTDFAQGADWATSILFSQEKNLCIIDDALLYWRYSGNNISAMAFSIKNEATVGHIQFLEWVLDHFQYLKKKPEFVTYEMIRKAVLKNFRTIINSHYRGYNYSLYNRLFFFLHQKAGISKLHSAFLLIAMKLECSIPYQLKVLFFKISNVLRRIKKMNLSKISTGN